MQDERRYWTPLNTILLILIIVGLGLIGTTKYWVPGLVANILEKDSSGQFDNYQKTLESY